MLLVSGDDVDNLRGVLVSVLDFHDLASKLFLVSSLLVLLPDVNVLENSFPDAEDDSTCAQSPQSRVGWATSDGSVEGRMASLPSPWIFLLSDWS